MTDTIKMDTTVLDRIARDLDKNVEDVVEGLAFEVEALQKQFSPVDTGAMMNSVYTVTKHSDGYASASGAAHAANPDVETAPLPKPTGKAIANVGPCVDYAIFVELGTSRKGARPFVGPSVTEALHKMSIPYTWQEVFD